MERTSGSSLASRCRSTHLAQVRDRRSSRWRSAKARSSAFRLRQRRAEVSHWAKVLRRLSGNVAVPQPSKPSQPGEKKRRERKKDATRLTLHLDIPEALHETELLSMLDAAICPLGERYGYETAVVGE